MPAGAGEAVRVGPSTGAIGSLPDTRMRHADVRARLLEAARDLMRESDGPGFTVTQVVAAAGTSLKSFYRSFASKDELLVALFEDDATRAAGALAAMVAGCHETTPRVRLLVVGLFRFLAEDGRLPYAAALVREHLRLAESHPDRLRDVLEPFVAVFADVLRDAQARGAVRPGDPRRDARTLFHLVVSHLHALICHQIDEPPDDVADELWAFCAAALRPVTPACS
jgi:AcrR family transcriptional regulator